MKKKAIFNIVFSGISIGLVFVLPFLTGQIPEIGKMLLPMHIPVILCGFICGWKYGLVVGLVSPILRSLIFGMPPIYPVALTMSFELGTYGFVSGILYTTFKKINLNTILLIYLTLIIAMIAGRVVWGGINFLIVLFDHEIKFSFHRFLTGAFISAWPGIIVQVVLIPALMIAIEKTHVLKNL